MIILLPAIITVIFFFLSGKKNKDNGVKWAVVGVIGYILGFSIGMTVIGETFISIFIACATVYLTYIQLSKSALKNKTTS